MSGFFARLKKREKHQPEPLKVTSTVDSTTLDEAATPSKVDPPSQPPPVEIESPKFPVETDSIFKGLKLSAQAAHTERSDSPYLRRAQHGDGEAVDGEEEDGEASSFSFLRAHQGKGQDSDSEKSSDEQTSSGFAFLNTTSGSPRDTHQGEGRQLEPVEDQTEKQPAPEERGEKTEQNDTSIDSKGDVEAKSPTSTDKSFEVMALLQPAAIKEVKSSITSRSPFKVGEGRSTGRQAPLVGGAKKKKKKKAVRPGQPTSTSQAEQDNLSSSKSDLSSRANDDNSSEVSEHSEQLIEIAASSGNDKEQKVNGAVSEEITIQPSADTTTIAEDNVQSSDVAMATEDVVTSVQKEPTPEPVTIETADEEAESRALEEVFGNYRVELSGEESYTALIESYQSSIKKIRDGSAHGEGEKSHGKIMEYQLSSVEQLISQRVEIQRLKEEEAKALNDEDYELAEQLSKKLEQMALLSEWDIAGNGLNALRDWMSQCAEVSENERELRASMQTQLVQLKEEQNKSLQEINKQLASLKNKEKMRLQVLQDKIDRDRGHIALDRQHLERSEAKLQEEVESRAAQPLAAKAELEEKLSQVESEIEELESKLNALKRERSKLKEGIAAEEVTIAAVREELSTEQLQLDKERQQIETRDSELKKEEEKLSRERHTMATTLMEEETKRDSLAKVIELAEAKCAELAGVNETLEELLSQLQPLVDDCREKMKPSQHITSLQEQCNNCALDVEKMSNEVLLTQTKITALTKKVSDDELQLQQLTDAKQAAVTGRQFKEAGRLATESKALSAKLDNERSEVKLTHSQLDELNKKLSGLSEQLNSLRQDTSSQEKKEDEEHIERLSQWTNQLRERRESVRGTALEEVLEKWCHLNQLLRESLSTKHGLTLKQTDENTENDILTEERTPGVGREEEGERERRDEGQANEGERNKLQERLSAIEAELEKACQEEDFDKAAELDEELQTVKNLLEH